MPEWRKIRAEIEAGASSAKELARRFDVAPETIHAAFRRMPDGKEQRRQMHENMTQRLAQPLQDEPLLPPETTQRLRAFADHYDETPAPSGLTQLVAQLMHSGIGMRPIALTVDKPLHVVQGWAAQGGYLSNTMRARHAEIREALNCGAASLQDIADLVGISPERVRQILYSMPEMEEIYKKIGVTKHRRLVRPDGTAPLPQQQTITEPEPARVITKHERERLLHVIDRARAVQRNAPPAARRAFTVRDEYVRKLLADGLTIDDLAEAAEVSRDAIRDWSSPAKTYRRQLITEAIARKQRAKRRS